VSLQKKGDVLEEKIGLFCDGGGCSSVLRYTKLTRQIDQFCSGRDNHCVAVEPKRSMDRFRVGERKRH